MFLPFSPGKGLPLGARGHVSRTFPPLLATMHQCLTKFFPKIVRIKAKTVLFLCSSFNEKTTYGSNKTAATAAPLSSSVVF